MKKYSLLFLILTAILANSCQKETITTDIDPSFEQYLIAKLIDTDGVVNGKISEKDLLGTSDLDISYQLGNKDWKFSSFSGLEKMIGLESLRIYMFIITINQLDLTQNKKLKNLTLNFNIINDFSLKIAKDNLINTLNLNGFKQVKFDFNQFNNLTLLALSYSDNHLPALVKLPRLNELHLNNCDQEQANISMPVNIWSCIKV